MAQFTPDSLDLLFHRAKLDLLESIVGAGGDRNPRATYVVDLFLDAIVFRPNRLFKAGESPVNGPGGSGGEAADEDRGDVFMDAVKQALPCFNIFEKPALEADKSVEAERYRLPDVPVDLSALVQDVAAETADARVSVEAADGSVTSGKSR